MRRAMLAAFSAIALTLASPGAALAHHGHRGHHHKGRIKAHHARVRFEHFGAPSPSNSHPSDSQTTTGSSGESTKPASPSEVVGTVSSFENEVLTLALNDGSTVKGKVTSRTRIECVPAAGTTTSSTEEGPGEDKGSGDDESHQADDKGAGDDESHEGDRQGPSSEQQGKEDESDQRSSDGEGADNDEGDQAMSAPSAEPACGTAALSSGTSVREAELRIGPEGAEFESVELVK